MDLKQIKELMAAMEKAGMKKLRIKQEKGFELELERPFSDHPHPPASRSEPTHHFQPSPSHLPHKHVHEEEKQEKAGTFISSPMVGTYYSAPSPDDAPFIKVGDEVTEATVICIIEAMKVMNEVKAGKKGRVIEICLSNADPVEFGTHILRIE